MTSPGKLAANAGNALASTGPQSIVGKAVSSANAIRHGLRATAIVLPHVETAEEWEEYRDAMVDAIAPVGALEEELAERVAAITWRLRRVTRYEASTAGAMQLDAEFDAAKRSTTLAESDDRNDERFRYVRKDVVADLGGDAECASELSELYSRVRRLADDESLPASDACDIVTDLADHAGLDPYSETESAIPGVPDDVAWPEWNGWTAGLVRVAAAAFAARADEGTGEKLYDSAGLSAAKRSGNAGRRHATAGAILERLRGERVIPRRDSAELVMRYETHLQRMLAATLAALGHARALRGA